MNKYILLAVIVSSIVAYTSRNRQNKSFTFSSEPVPSSYSFLIEQEHPVIRFQRLLDSANGYRLGDSIPDFFFNHRLDYEHPWLTDHHQFSIRKMVIDSTTNLGLLRTILSSNDPRLRKIVDSSEVTSKRLLNGLPFKATSTYQLVQERVSKGNTIP